MQSNSLHRLEVFGKTSLEPIITSISLIIDGAELGQGYLLRNVIEDHLYRHAHLDVLYFTIHKIGG